MTLKYKLLTFKRNVNFAIVLGRELNSYDYTGAKDRLDDLKSATSSLVTLQQTHEWERSGQGAKSGWLSPIEIDEASDPIGADMDQLSGHDTRRASSKGFLNLTLEFYLDLLDWTGRNLASGKRQLEAAKRTEVYSSWAVSDTVDCVRQFKRFEFVGSKVAHLVNKAIVLR